MCCSDARRAQTGSIHLCIRLCGNGIAFSVEIIFDFNILYLQTILANGLQICLVQIVPTAILLDIVSTVGYTIDLELNGVNIRIEVCVAQILSRDLAVNHRVLHLSGCLYILQLDDYGNAVVELPGQ